MTIECLCLGTVGLIVAPWKFDVLKTSIFVLEASLLGQREKALGARLLAIFGYSISDSNWTWGNTRSVGNYKREYSLNCTI